MKKKSRMTRIEKIKEIVSEHKIETGTTIFLICVIIFFTFAVHSCMKNIKEAGGFRTVVVESGKEIKLLANDIDKAYEEEKDNAYR